jgi:hypothetical protein
MKLIAIRLLCCGGMFLTFCLALLAQEAVKTASIELMVKDPGGAVIPHAYVRVVPSPNIGYLATDSEGKLSLALSPGSYELSVAFPGFSTVRNRIEAIAGVRVCDNSKNS